MVCIFACSGFANVKKYSSDDNIRRFHKLNIDIVLLFLHIRVVLLQMLSILLPSRNLHCSRSLWSFYYAWRYLKARATPSSSTSKQRLKSKNYTEIKVHRVRSTTNRLLSTITERTSSLQPLFEISSLDFFQHAFKFIDVWCLSSPTLQTNNAWNLSSNKTFSPGSYVWHFENRTGW